MLIGLVGNSVLLLMLFRHRRMRNAPNTYILSLAIGDILVLVICVPYIGSIYVFESWHLGLLACKIGEYANDLSNGVSIFTLTALSVDRYFSIVDPWNLRARGHARQTRRFAIIIAALVWLLAIIVAIPAGLAYVRFFRVNRNMTFCVCYPFPDEFGPNYPKMIVLYRFLIYYVIPLIIISIFYVLMALHLIRSMKALGEMQVQMKQVQARKKLVWMTLIFVITFAICFLPKFIFMMWFHFNSTSQFDYNYFWHYFRILGFGLAFFNSCINPFTLYFASNTYKKYFNRYLCRWRIQKVQHQQFSDLSSDYSSRGLLRSFSYVKSKRRDMKLSSVANNMRLTNNTPTGKQKTYGYLLTHT
ncbi:neuropeptide CCHamide-1 receptor-like isoform X2 [Pseudomyrmex gracilis]|nr:neuropeptide CCHamide-1 receptor-like isoform X2 [Pseudomyrmex gracilis]